MKKNQFWISKARIVRLEKVYEDSPLIQGVPKEDQYYYDCNPMYVGGFGTYRFITPMYWELKYCVYKPGPGYDDQLTYTLNVHKYVTKTLQPRLEWYRLSQNRLNLIREKLVGKKVKLLASGEVEYGRPAKSFIPFDYDNWDMLFDSLLIDLN